MNIAKLKLAYLKSKNARVGMDCICPSCGTEFFKQHHQQAFCKTKSGTKCKDKYWNTVTPHKRNNRTRISPASAAWTAQQQHDRDSVYDSFHPFEGLNDDEYKNH